MFVHGDDSALYDFFENLAIKQSVSEMQPQLFCLEIRVKVLENKIETMRKTIRDEIVSGLLDAMSEAKDRQGEERAVQWLKKENDQNN